MMNLFCAQLVFVGSNEVADSCYGISCEAHNCQCRNILNFRCTFAAVFCFSSFALLSLWSIASAAATTVDRLLQKPAFRHVDFVVWRCNLCDARSSCVQIASYAIVLDATRESELELFGKSTRQSEIERDAQTHRIT